MMIRIAAALLASAALTAPAFGAEQLTAQQQKMKDCNRTASEQQMKGDQRREFMSQCLRKDGGEQLTAQQERMKTCNRQASDKDLKGDQRRAFMSDCLRADRGEHRSPAAGGSRPAQR